MPAEKRAGRPQRRVSTQSLSREDGAGFPSLPGFFAATDRGWERSGTEAGSRQAADHMYFRGNKMRLPQKTLSARCVLLA